MLKNCFAGLPFCEAGIYMCTKYTLIECALKNRKSRF